MNSFNKNKKNKIMIKYINNFDSKNKDLKNQVQKVKISLKNSNETPKIQYVEFLNNTTNKNLKHNNNNLITLKTQQNIKSKSNFEEINLKKKFYLNESMNSFHDNSSIFSFKQNPINLSSFNFSDKKQDKSMKYSYLDECTPKIKKENSKNSFQFYNIIKSKNIFSKRNKMYKINNKNSKKNNFFINISYNNKDSYDNITNYSNCSSIYYLNKSDINLCNYNISKNKKHNNILINYSNKSLNKYDNIILHDWCQKYFKKFRQKINNIIIIQKIYKGYFYRKKFNKYKKYIIKLKRFSLLFKEIKKKIFFMIFNYKKFKSNEKIKLILTYFVIILKRKIRNLIQNFFDLIKIYSNINKIKNKIKYNLRIKNKKKSFKNLSIDIITPKNIKKNFSCKSEYYRAISQKKIALNLFTLKNNNYNIKKSQKEKLKTNENVIKTYKKILIQNLIEKTKKFLLKKIKKLFIFKLKLKKLKYKIEMINDFYNKKKFFFNWKERVLLKNKKENIKCDKTVKKYNNILIKVNKKSIKQQNYFKKFNIIDTINKIKIKKFLEKLLKITKLKTFKFLFYYKKNNNQKYKKNQKHIYNKEKYKNYFNFKSSQKK